MPAALPLPPNTAALRLTPVLQPRPGPLTIDLRRICQAKPSTFSSTKRSLPGAPRNTASLNVAADRKLS